MKPSILRLEMIESSGAGKYPIGEGSGTFSCGLVASNDPS